MVLSSSHFERHRVPLSTYAVLSSFLSALYHSIQAYCSAYILTHGFTRHPYLLPYRGETASRRHCSPLIVTLSVLLSFCPLAIKEGGNVLKSTNGNF